ncbi:alcohol dehydrogenase catalytic domain-containing protein [Nocardia vinacea]|uniref:alcohol dehydrogenase catalytic domain-containing protein n=1 Tax=Nocardia vinacea TaxID=96468 RepID=UPI0002DAF07A|nr:alcohol dehydrogenase catalytic domain-containing protein [Nocardia vinacea]
MSRVVVFDETGAPEVLHIVDEPVGNPGAGEVRLRIEAVGINRLDQMVRTGMSPRPIRLPHARLGVEATGTIDALGTGVERWSIGDPVIVTAVPDMDSNGTYAEHIVLPADRVVARPPSWTPSVPQRCGWRTPPPTARSWKRPRCNPATMS